MTKTGLNLYNIQIVIALQRVIIQNCRRYISSVQLDTNLPIGTPDA